MTSARAGDLTQRVSGLILRFVFQSKIAERQKADQPLVSIHDGQTAYAQIPHVLRHFVHRLVFEAVLDLRAHDLSHWGVGTSTLRHGAHRDVAVGNHSDQSVVLLHRQRANVHFGHLLSRVSEDRKSTRLNSSHVKISYAVFCLKKKKNTIY